MIVCYSTIMRYGLNLEGQRHNVGLVLCRSLRNISKWPHDTECVLLI